MTTTHGHRWPGGSRRADAQGYPFGFPLPDIERQNNPNIP
jgi:hypothetical protein